MSFKGSLKRLVVFWIVFQCILNIKAQSLPGNYQWDQLGPFITPVSNAEKGQWSCTGIGWIESLEVRDNGKTIYAGTITGGLYLTRDSGHTWTQIYNNGLQTGILDMVVNGREIYVATGLTHYDEPTGNGVWYSKNEGKSWKATGLQFDLEDKAPLWCIEMFSDEKTLLALGNDKIYRSDNKAKSWQLVAEYGQTDFRHLQVSSFNPDLCLASGKKMYVSNDRGLTWKDKTYTLTALDSAFPEQINLVQRIAIAIDPNISGRIMAAYSFHGYVYLDESLDEGKTWLNVSKTRNVRRFDRNHAELVIAPGNSDIVFLGAVRLFISKDRAKSFELSTNPAYQTDRFVHDDVRSMVVTESGSIFLGTDGGVFRSTDAGKTWVDINGTGLNAVMFYGIGLTDSGIIGGCQDLGYLLYKDGIWTHLGDYYGDGGDAYQLGDAIHLLIAGRHRAIDLKTLKPLKIADPPSKMNPFTANYSAVPGNVNGLYFVSDHLYRYNGSNWKNLTEGLDNQGYKANCVHINQEHPEFLYFAFDQPTWGNPDFSRKFFRSLDAGQTWENITENLPILNWRYISSITTNPKKPMEVYISLGMIDEGEINKVYRSSDGGTSWQNWSDGLGPLQSFKITFLDGSQSGILLATVDGLYYRNGSMSEWTRFECGFPEIAVRDFEIDYTNHQIYVATYGNGLWALALSDKFWKD